MARRASSSSSTSNMPRSGVRQVSGPVSAHVFGLPGDGSVYIFGDQHHSVRNRCSPCRRSEGCASIIDFIEEHVRAGAASGTPVDVFLELPYAPSPSRSHHDRALRSVRRQFFSEAAAAATQRGRKGDHQEDGGDQDAQRQARYVGLLGDMFSRFQDKMYGAEKMAMRNRRAGPGGGKAGGGGSNVRFHYADIRWEANVRVMLDARSPHWILQHARTSTKVRALLMAFLFGTDFPGDVARICGPEANVIASSLSTLPGRPGVAVHKVAKQYHKLPEGHAKSALRAYLEGRLDDIVRVLKDHVGYDSMLGVVAAAHARKNRDQHKWDTHVLQAHAAYALQSLSSVVRFGLRVLLMDAYLMCRMMRYASAFPGGTTIVYVGDGHAEEYVGFLKFHLRAPQVRSSDPAVEADVSVRRCVRVA